MGTDAEQRDGALCPELCVHLDTDMIKRVVCVFQHDFKKRQMSGCQGLGKGGMGSGRRWAGALLRGRAASARTRAWWLHNSLNAPNATDCALGNGERGVLCA